LRLTAIAGAAFIAGCGGGGGSGAAGDSSSASSPTTPAANAAGVAATLNVQQQQVAGSATLDPRFASLSFEKSHINTSPGVYFGPNNASLIGLLNALGGGVLRIGANSVDRITWTPAGAGQTSGQVSQNDVANFANFIKQCPKWSVIYAINFAGAEGSSASPCAGGV